MHPGQNDDRGRDRGDGIGSGAYAFHGGSVGDPSVDQVTSILDWSEAGSGDPMYDLAILTLATRNAWVICSPAMAMTLILT
ncbi:aminoglycoside phosphotransferase family protein [Microlunatus endophyticus]|uniref:aminoglycoside phosphotransferase family protein n=1 Tax=Microlunatus endophyticus TaxID=1716077 RepID=UPI001E2D1A81|nr:aminoglycoside phosphotransferase family protein [Microlunatus endophyticus]